MYVQIPNNYDKFFHLLYEAISKNTVRPRPNEEEKMTVSRFIRCSPEIEGDSQLAIVLFCGIALVYYKATPEAIMEHAGIESNEFIYKVTKFKSNMAEALKLKKLPKRTPFEILSSSEIDLRKLVNKVKMINNYINFYAAGHGILLTSAGRDGK